MIISINFVLKSLCTDIFYVTEEHYFGLKLFVEMDIFIFVLP